MAVKTVLVQGDSRQSRQFLTEAAISARYVTLENGNAVRRPLTSLCIPHYDMVTHNAHARRASNRCRSLMHGRPILWLALRRPAVCNPPPPPCSLQYVNIVTHTHAMLQRCSFLFSCALSPYPLAYTCAPCLRPPPCSLQHVNIVTTYLYELRPLDEVKAPGSASMEITMQERASLTHTHTTATNASWGNRASASGVGLGDGPSGSAGGAGGAGLAATAAGTTSARVLQAAGAGAGPGALGSGLGSPHMPQELGQRSCWKLYIVQEFCELVGRHVDCCGMVHRV